MNALGLALVWCALQVTLVGVVAGLAYAVLHRRGPTVRSLIALTALALSVGLTLAAFSPWPRWLASASRAQEAQRSAAGEVAAETSSGRAAPTDGQHPGGARRNAVQPGTVEMARSFWQALVNELEHRPATPAESSAWTWTSLLVVLFGGGVALGLVRLVAAALMVGSYRRRSRAITDPATLLALSEVCAELGCRRKVELRESARLATAAMLGWWRPLVLLPAEWTAWSASELRAVLAHEIAHVSRGDFAAWVCAQLGLILHFYHPLVHWLAGRLRLDQELAADAAAARVAGGRQPYLRILADMALRQSDRVAGWPARAFLPTRGTFLRRIEMLRATKQVPAAASRRLCAVTVGGLVLAGLAAAGLRGSGGESAAAAAQRQNGGPRATAAERDGGETLYTKHIPNEAQGFVAVRPAALLARPEMKPFFEFVASTEQMQSWLGLPLGEIDQLSWTLIPPVVPDRRPRDLLLPIGALTVRTTKANDFRELISKAAPDAVRIPAAGGEYFRSTDGNGLAYFRPDDRTIIVGSVQDIARMIGTGPETGWKRLADGPTQEAIAGAHYAVVVETALVESMYQQAGATVRQEQDHARRDAARAAGRPLPPNPAAGAAVIKEQVSLSAFAPLWKQAESITFALTLGERLSIEWLFDSENEADAKQVRRTVEALLTLGQNMSSSLGEVARREAAGQPAGPLLTELTKLAEELLEQAEVTQDGSRVRLATAGSLAGAQANAVGALTESIKAARTAAKRTMSMNNLKQIGIAFHNYHDAYGRFPPAVLYGPDGKTPHSWRVAILPFLDQAALHDQYRFNEPWDSAHNKQLLQRIPPMFRHPEASQDSTTAAYYALVGPETVFSGKQAPKHEAGTRLQEIQDGTSNTLLVVEAKREIPWTKPEDIPYDAGKDLPELGGFFANGFNAALCDGSVRFFPETTAQATLRAMISRAGAEPVPQP